MSLRHLSALLSPRSIAVIGASNRDGSIGQVVMRNLLDGRFAGPVMPVNPKAHAVAGVLAYADIDALPETPDLAVICTPAPTLPGLVARLGARGTHAAVVISSGLTQPAADGETWQAKMQAAARPSGLRILGGAALGLLVPRLALNASVAHVKALPGRLAFISQSGALCASVLDWALPRGIGFSHFVALGDGADVGFDDLLDYLGTDPGTAAILLYLETIAERRNFMAAARAAARNKPVLAVKAGLCDGLDGGETLAGRIATPDAVFDGALRRAGILRVTSIDELFAAVETLARARPVRGDRVAVLTTGGGTGVMASDEMKRGGGRLAELADDTRARLKALVPQGNSVANPVDLGFDAPARRYAEALKVLDRDKGVDAVLVMHAPSALTSSEAAAQAVIEATRQVSCSVFTCWVGGQAVAEARRAFAAAGMASYDTPRAAVGAFLHLVEHRRVLDMLMETPPSMAEQAPDRDAARAVIAAALAEGRTVLGGPEAKALLDAYGLPVVPARQARDAGQAAAIAAAEGFPVALTLDTPEQRRLWDVGGIALTLESPDAVRAAAEAMAARARARLPEMRQDGFLVQRMISRVNARQLLMGVANDALFGPAIVFGEGGRAVETSRGHAVALPPLNMPLARELVERSGMAALLGESPDRPAADLDAVCRALCRLSQMLVDLPELVEMEINPLFADDRGVTVVDARVVLGRPAEERRLAIRPYPQELEETVTLRDGAAALLRPIRPEDEPAHRALKEAMSPEDTRMRFFGSLGPVTHAELARYTQIDYEREMAFVAVRDGVELGAVRLICDPDLQSGEFGIAVRSDLKRLGLGRMLMEKTVRYARHRGLPEIRGKVLAENTAMLGLCERLGFVRESDDGEVVALVLATNKPSPLMGEGLGGGDAGATAGGRRES